MKTKGGSMNKLLTFFAMLLGAVASLGACEVTLDNDRGYFTFVIDKNSGEKKLILPKKPSIIGKDPSIHANFVMHVQKSLFSAPERYLVEQIACSPTP